MNTNTDANRSMSASSSPAQHFLTISFLTDNPLSSDVVEAASAEKLYSIATEARGFEDDTTVLRDAQGNTFAEWTQRSLGRDEVVWS